MAIRFLGDDQVSVTQVVSAPATVFVLPATAAPQTVALWLNGIRLGPKLFIVEDGLVHLLGKQALVGDTVEIRCNLQGG